MADNTSFRNLSSASAISYTIKSGIVALNSILSAFKCYIVYNSISSMVIHIIYELSEYNKVKDVPIIP